MRTSTRIFIAALVLAAAGLGPMLYVQSLRRDFTGPMTITMGTAQRSGALLGSTRRSKTPWFCWVSYEFTPPDGSKRHNWQFWEPACGVSPGRAIPIQYVIANPDVNRPAGYEPWFPSWLFFFAAGALCFTGVIIYRAEGGEPYG